MTNFFPDPEVKGDACLLLHNNVKMPSHSVSPSSSLHARAFVGIGTGYYSDKLSTSTKTRLLTCSLHRWSFQAAKALQITKNTHHHIISAGMALETEAHAISEQDSAAAALTSQLPFTNPTRTLMGKVHNAVINALSWLEGSDDNQVTDIPRLTLHYQLPRLIHLIVPACTLKDSYNALCRRILTIEFALYEIKQCWQMMMSFSSWRCNHKVKHCSYGLGGSSRSSLSSKKGITTSSSLSRKEMETSISSIIWNLRFRMDFFLTTLLSYFKFDVVFISFQKLKESILSSVTYDEVAEAHG
eukprot:11450550-Ditylum_brightwellii.AAC.1